MTTTTPRLRWSSVRDCPRKAVYEALDAPARERTDRERRIMFRGRRIGRDYADMVAEVEGEDAIERERKVEWPLGIGHIDVYVKATKTVIEVLSSAHATAELVHSKQLQAIGYVLHDPEAENAVLVVVNPSDFSEQRIIMLPGTPVWEQLVAEVRDRINTVLAWAEHGDMPARVCKQPTDSWGHFCMYAAVCFEDWQPPALEEDADAETLELTAALYAAKLVEREARQAYGLAETTRKEVEQRLADRFPPGKRQVGPYQLNRSVRERKTFRLAIAEKDSRFAPIAGLIDEFTTVSTYEVWSIDRRGEPEAQPDYGEAPF